MTSYQIESSNHEFSHARSENFSDNDSTRISSGNQYWSKKRKNISTDSDSMPSAPSLMPQVDDETNPRSIDVVSERKTTSDDNSKEDLTQSYNTKIISESGVKSFESSNRQYLHMSAPPSMPRRSFSPFPPRISTTPRRLMTRPQQRAPSSTPEDDGGLTKPQQRAPSSTPEDDGETEVTRPRTGLEQHHREGKY